MEESIVPDFVETKTKKNYNLNKTEEEEVVYVYVRRNPNKGELWVKNPFNPTARTTL